MIWQIANIQKCFFLFQTLLNVTKNKFELSFIGGSVCNDLEAQDLSTVRLTKDETLFFATLSM